ncbi:MAG: hypothetical protein ABI162_10970 [Luteolibacter sp.]
MADLKLAPVVPDRRQESFPVKSQKRTGGSGFPKAGRRRGRVSADSNVDHDHLDRRETVKTLVIIMMFILAFAACLAVAWFMKDWIGK